MQLKNYQKTSTHTSQRKIPTTLINVQLLIPINHQGNANANGKIPLHIHNNSIQIKGLTIPNIG